MPAKGGDDAGGGTGHRHDLATAQLTATAQLHLAVHLDQAVADVRLRLCPRVEQVREFEELTKPNGLVADRNVNQCCHHTIMHRGDTNIRHQ